MGQRTHENITFAMVRSNKIYIAYRNNIKKHLSKEQDTVLALFGSKIYANFNAFVPVIDVVLSMILVFFKNPTGTKMKSFFFMTSLMSAKHEILVQMRYNMMFYEYFSLKLDPFTCENHFYSLRASS